jgi:DNA invertase Pin-like site-specific DNA recombinase
MNASNSVHERRSKQFTGAEGGGETALPVFAFGTNKIEHRHLEQLAFVYVRQSDPQQVRRHRESTDLQYQLVQLAMQLGWSQDRIEVIDEDLGISAKHIEGRAGFQRLMTEVGLDHAGIIIGIEMSRLARSCKDWYQLLELCALFGTVLADPDGVYNPGNYNDRLLLGLKGTMSEAELHIMHGRLAAGRMNKARRGELFHHAPIGYVRTLSGEMVLDPDEQARSVVRMIFDKFDELASVNSLLQYLVHHKILLGFRPHYGANRGQLEWRRPNRPTLQSILHNPIYTGAYCYGRRAVDPRRKIPGRPTTGRTVVPPNECAVLLKDRLPAYITWERYEANLRKMKENQARAASLGAPREGLSLLGGILKCGKCGCRMIVGYQDKGATHRYSCMHRTVNYGEPLCQSLAGKHLDALVCEQVLAALEPAALELSLKAAEDIDTERARLHRHWKQQLERVRYDTERAARQYQVVEPENRLVARALESQWEQALVKQRQTEEEYARFELQQPSRLCEDETQLIRSLSADIPALWHANTTSPKDQQAILRHLIECVTVVVQGESERVDVTIHWAGGFESQHEQTRPVARYDQLIDYSRLVARILELRKNGNTSAQIAKMLNQEGFKPPKRRSTYNTAMVRQLLSRNLPRKEQSHASNDPIPLNSDEWLLPDLAHELQMPATTLHNWLRRGWVEARKLNVGRGHWVLRADSDEIGRLRQLRSTKQGWPDRPYPEFLTKPKRLAGS